MTSPKATGLYIRKFYECLGACDVPVLVRQGFRTASFPSEVAMAVADHHQGLVDALKAADQWIKLLVKEMDIEPEDTTVTVNAVGPDGKRELAKLKLAQSQTQIEAALASVQR